MGLEFVCKFGLAFGTMASLAIQAAPVQAYRRTQVSQHEEAQTLPLQWKAGGKGPGRVRCCHVDTFLGLLILFLSQAASIDGVVLGLSQCNERAYHVWLYGVPPDHELRGMSRELTGLVSFTDVSPKLRPTTPSLHSRRAQWLFLTIA